MQLAHLRTCSGRVSGAATRRGNLRSVVVRSSSWESYDNTPPPTPEAPGAKVEKWLKTPFDLAAFGPRAGVGALLSIPLRIQNLQNDVNRAIELLQDPRPLQEKQDVVLREVEDTVVEFLEKGATIESDILANVKTVLPSDIVNIIDELIPEPPNKQPYSGYQGYSDYSPPGAEQTPPPPAPVVTYYQADVQDSQIASEMTEIRSAVSALRSALDAVRTNTDISNTNMLRLKLREARDLLARRLGEVSPATANDANIAAATREARILLEEVDAQFF